MKFEVVVADITTLDVDAIVCAANTALAGGGTGSGQGGVEGAIHRAAGPKLAIATRPFAPLERGEAVMTPGFNLRARHVIHTVGPIWRGGGNGEPDLLRRCYSRSVELAGSAGLATVGFPGISVGAFGYPAELASTIAVDAIAATASRYSNLERTVLCCFSELSADTYRRLLDQVEG